MPEQKIYEMLNKEIDIKNLYRFSSKEKIVYIDIEIDYYRDIYSDWDFSPFVQRELDRDLFEYLEECADEIPKKMRLVIIFHIPEEIKDTEKEKKSIIGYKNYFNYQLRKLQKHKKNSRKLVFFYGFLGLSLIALAMLLQQKFVDLFYINFLTEGIYVGGWVLFWELFSILFFKNSEFKQKYLTLSRLKNSEIIYKTKRKDEAQ